MLGKRAPLVQRPPLCRTATPAQGFWEIDHQLAQCADLTGENFAEQFVNGEFVGDPNIDPNPERTDEEERALRVVADQAMNDPKGAGAAITQRMVDMVERLIVIDNNPFRFVSTVGEKTYDRSYLKPLYDFCAEYPKGCRNQIWHTGRQVEKSVLLVKTILLANNQRKLAKDIEVGDLVVSVDEATLKTTARPVTWVSQVYTKPAYEITTRQGHTAIFGHEHPLLADGKWTPAEQIKPEHKLGAIRRMRPVIKDTLTTEHDLQLARLLGWMISEGCMTQDSWSVTNSDPTVLAEIDLCVEALTGVSAVRRYAKTSTNPCSEIRLPSAVRDHLRQYLPEHSSSFTHRVPPWLYDKNLEVRAAFLNRLWGGDGYVKRQAASKWDIEYSSVSEELCRDVQALLWGFGIPTSIRSFKPTLYKDTNRLCWQLRVETLDGVRRFLKDVGAFGKDAVAPSDEAITNNNRDVIPQSAAQALIDKFYGKRRSRNSAKTLGGAGLRRKLKYAPTVGKLREYMAALGIEDAPEATRWLSEDIMWDDVVAVEYVGEKECIDFTVDVDHNFVVGGLITHNSTTQAGKSIVLGAVYPAYKSLYVAPRFDQVSVFSSQRFKPMAEDSAELCEHLVKPSKTLWQVGMKEFTNRSFFNFRSCYMTADGCRGVSAHHLMIDEIQDILSDNIPVLEECQGHWDWDTGLKVRTYAGTPKTNNNSITRRYKQSCQFEWMTKCQACNHWNFPDETIIGPKSYICTRCARDIFPQQHGTWVPQNRAALDNLWGFRLPQMVVPFQSHSSIAERRDDPNVSRLKFHNECLGMPYDDGEIVLTEADIRLACEGGDKMMTPEQIRILANNGVPIFAGLDHGTGEGNHPSFTVLSIGHFKPSTSEFVVRYIKKFTGKEASLVQQPEIISDICDRAGVHMMMADWGFGAYQNARMVADFGWDWIQGKRVLMQAMYVRQRLKCRFDSASLKYLIDRNQSMNDCIDAIKRRTITFFCLEEFQRFSADFTTIYTEYNDRYGTSSYDHVDPDDCFHAVNYAYMAGQQFFGQLSRSGVPDIENLDTDDIGY